MYFLLAVILLLPADSSYVDAESLHRKQDSIPLEGNASYYSNKFTGRKTSSGDIYSPKKYTCAHRSLPFGTLIKVTNPKNGKSVVVKVNDRGGFYKKRILDLSLAAAKDLGIIRQGHAKVVLELFPADSLGIAPATHLTAHVDRSGTDIVIDKSVKIKANKTYTLAHTIHKKKGKKHKEKGKAKVKLHTHKVKTGKRRPSI